MYVGGIFTLILLKLWLVSDQTLWARANFMHDDLLFVRLADNLLQFGWLGPYDNLTLAKEPFYPIWIAFSFLISVPLLLSQHLLYILASLITCRALQPLIESSILRTALFVLLLFNPVTFTFSLTCVLRDTLYPSLTLLVVGSMIGLFVRRHAATYSLIGWATICGLATAVFWLTREEGIWIIPFIAPLGAWTIAAAMLAKPRNWNKIVVLTSPLLLSILVVQGISLLNLIHYGVYTIVESKTPEFRAAYGALTRVGSMDYKPQVPVPKQIMERIYTQSPAFAELRPFFERAGFWTLRSMGFENHSSGADEIGGGWFMWALRDAVSAAGYFNSGAQSSAFFQRLANEINAACEAKRLACLEEKRSSLMPPWRNEYLFPVIEQIGHGLTILTTFIWILPDFVIGEGTPANLELFRDLTREKLLTVANNSQGQILVKGWAVHTLETLAVSLIDAKTQNIISVGQFDASPDIYQYFLNMHQNILEANHARFKVQGHCLTPCMLRISDSKQKILADIPIKKGPTVWLGDPLWVYLDEVSNGALSRQTQLSILKQSLLKKIAAIYQTISPFLATIGLLTAVIWLIQPLRSRIPTALGFIALCIVMASFTRLLILAIIQVTSFPAIGVVYMSPLYPLLLLCYSLFIIDFLAKYKQTKIRFNSFWKTH